MNTTLEWPHISALMPGQYASYPGPPARIPKDFSTRSKPGQGVHLHPLEPHLRRTLRLIPSATVYDRSAHALWGKECLDPCTRASPANSRMPSRSRHGTSISTLTTPTMIAGPKVATEAVEKHQNLVSWTLSGSYHQHHQVLIDAADPTRIITLSRAREIITAFIGAFKADSTVCLHLTNDITYPVIVLGILANRCRWTGTNTAYGISELEHNFRLSDTRYVITADEHLATVQQAVEASGTKAEIIRFVDILRRSPLDPNGGKAMHLQMRTLRDLMGTSTETDLSSALQSIKSGTVAALMQTSGTTGRPKMAARTHHSLIVESLAIEDNDSTKPYEVRRLIPTPIFHAFTFVPLVINALRFGGTNYVMKRYDDSFAQKVHDFAITETMGAPPMLRLLVKDPSKRPLLQSLRLIHFGGAVLGPELRQMTLEMFDLKPRLVPVYGMTEGGWFTTLRYPEVDNTGSVGRPTPGYEVKVGDIRGLASENRDRSVGEILVRGPQVMTGYLSNATASRDAFVDGWLRTGDVGYVDDGKVYLVDRAKELIKVNGWQVAPAELEDVLMQSEHVDDVAVFGVGEEDDEHPLACIVARSENVVTAEMVKMHLSSRLARYKTSRCEVRFVKAIPKSSAGKILKKIMKQQLAAGTLF